MQDGKPDGQGTAIIGGAIWSGAWTHGCLREASRSTWWISKADCGN